MEYQNMGRFAIRTKLIKWYPEQIAEIFAKLQMIPVKADYAPDRDVIEYTGICNQFEKIGHNARIIFYVIQVFKSENGEISNIQVAKTPDEYKAILTIPAPIPKGAEEI